MFKWLINWVKTRLYSRKMKKFTRYYRDRPDKFCEKYFGMKFYPYQKKMIRDMSKSK